jgi:DnaK suppressor protein
MALTPTQIETLAQRLDARRATLAAELREHIERARQHGMPAVEGAVGDEADRAFAELLRNTDEAELRRDLAEFTAIEAAQKRMTEGEYGTCATCGEPIGFDRLLAQPAALRCLRCQDLHEHTYAPPGAAEP